MSGLKGSYFWFHRPVLMKLAEESFSRDVSLSLCYLLALPDVSEV